MPNRSAVGLLAFGLLAGVAVADRVEAPLPQPASHAGVGMRAPDLTATAIDGTPFQLSAAVKGKKAFVVAITSATCPVSKKYLPTLAALEKEYAAKGVGFAVIDAIGVNDVADMKAAVAAAGLKAPYLHDTDGTLCKALGANTTTDLFVLDAARTVKYHGAIDDQYGLGYSKAAPKHAYAKEAIEAVLKGALPEVTATTAPGCELALDDVKAPAAPKPTYHNFVSRLVQQNCQECHRKGGIGPFSLESLADLTAHKGMIKKVLEDGTMPPWNAVGAKAGEPRRFKNDRSLPAADKEAFLAWLEGGRTEGDVADAPLSRNFSDEWAIGKPDLVVQIPEPIEVPATGIMEYQNVVVETDLPEDKWVQSAEIQPTDRSVVHHVLVFALPPKKPGQIELPRRGEGQGYYAAYVPGNSKQLLPEGFGKKLPKGARIKFQIHYTPNGIATQDQVRVGFKFADTPPRHEVRVFPIGNPKIEIPPQADNHKEVAQMTLPIEVVLTAFSPHMHVRGKAARYEYDVIDPETKKVTETKVLLEVPEYDFNWQLRYELAEPVKLPAGTVVRYIAWYDNSSGNPANPNPDKRVKWGDQTYDEMMLGYAEWYSPLLVVNVEKK